MEDFLLEVISELLDGLFEAVLEYLLAMFVVTLLRIADNITRSLALKGELATSVILGLMGLSAGLLSIPIFPHHLLHPAKVHGINLLVSPVLTGLMLSWTGSALRKREKETTPIERFGYGFIFAFGIALMRLLFAR
jgi:hypothetical protein